MNVRDAESLVKRLKLDKKWRERKRFELLKAEADKLEKEAGIREIERKEELIEAERVKVQKRESLLSRLEAKQ